MEHWFCQFCIQTCNLETRANKVAQQSNANIPIMSNSLTPALQSKFLNGTTFIMLFLECWQNEKHQYLCSHSYFLLPFGPTVMFWIGEVYTKN